MPACALRSTTLTVAALLGFACAEPPVDGPPPLNPETVVVCHEGRSTTIRADELEAHTAHGDTRACIEGSRDGGTDRDASELDGGGLEIDAGVMETDGGTDDPGPILDVISDPPAFGIVGVEYRYRPISTTNRAEPRLSLVTGPDDARIDDDQLRWTPSDTSTVSFTIAVEAGGLRREQSFTVRVAEPRALVTRTIEWRRGGQLVVRDSNTELDGLTLTIAPGALDADTEVTIAELIGPTEPPLPNHVAASRSFVVRPELPGVSATLRMPVPANISLAVDELVFVQTSLRDPPFDGRGRGRYQDAVVLLDDLASHERRTVESQLAMSASATRLVSSRYLRLEADRTRLYWNLAPSDVPPVADAERVIATTEEALMPLTGSLGCAVTASVAVFVADFVGPEQGLALPGAFFIRPTVATASPERLRAVVAHELVHVSQFAMLPGWSYSLTASWWSEAIATFGADLIFDNDEYVAAFGPWTESVVTEGWIGLPQSPQAYRLVTLFKHLRATRALDICRFMATNASALAANDFERAIEAETGRPAVETLAEFTAVYSVYRNPGLMDDIQALGIGFTARRVPLGRPLAEIEYIRIYGGQAQLVVPQTNETITVLARNKQNSVSGAASVVRFFQLDGGVLTKIAELDGDETTFEVTGPFAVVAASVPLAVDFNRTVELIESLRINGVVHDVNGRPVRAYVTLVEEPDVEDHSSLRDGAFGLDEIPPTNDPLTVRATCASDPTLTVTTTAMFDRDPTINVGVLTLTGECPSIEILEPANGTTLTYGPYRISGLTNLPHDRLTARGDGRPDRRGTLVTRASTTPGVRTFSGLLANTAFEEGPHYIEVYADVPGPGQPRVDVEKKLPRAWGAINRLTDICSGSCPRVVISSNPTTVLQLQHACAATDIADCINRYQSGSCTARSTGGTEQMPGNGSTTYVYQTSMICMAADCERPGNRAECDGQPYDIVWDHWANAPLANGSDGMIGSTQTQGYDCRGTVGRAVYTADVCPEEFNAYCSFEFSPFGFGECRYCGDGTCSAFEPDACAADCGSCGDGVCSADGLESALTCPRDCASCGDGICSAPDEDSTNCNQDCACGNGVCDQEERSGATCPADCD